MEKKNNMEFWFSNKTLTRWFLHGSKDHPKDISKAKARNYRKIDWEKEEIIALMGFKNQLIFYGSPQANPSICSSWVLHLPLLLLPFRDINWKDAESRDSSECTTRSPVQRMKVQSSNLTCAPVYSSQTAAISSTRQRDIKMLLSNNSVFPTSTAGISPQSCNS